MLVTEIDSSNDLDKIERPKSEGHAYTRQFSPKRTSSYGVGAQDLLQSFISKLKLLK